MNRGPLLLLSALAVSSALLVAFLTLAPLASGSLVPSSTSAPARSSSNSSTSAIPPVVCPLPPVNTTFGPMSCFQMLDLTEVFVILFGVAVTLYVFMDAEKAELPGDAAEVAVTGEEELEMRHRRDEEEHLRGEIVRSEMEGKPP